VNAPPLTLDTTPFTAETDAFVRDLERLKYVDPVGVRAGLSRLQILIAEKRFFRIACADSGGLEMRLTDEARALMASVRDIEWQAERQARSILRPVLPVRIEGPTPHEGVGVVRTFAAVVARRFSSLFGRV
jgi:hypothetical protein